MLTKRYTTSSMQKSGVKTLSIIDTISELAQNENEASRLTLPSPISGSGSPANRSPVKKKFSSPVVSISSSIRSSGMAANALFFHKKVQRIKTNYWKKCLKIFFSAPKQRFPAP